MSEDKQPSYTEQHSQIEQPSYTEQHSQIEQPVTDDLDEHLLLLEQSATFQKLKSAYTVKDRVTAVSIDNIVDFIWYRENTYEPAVRKLEYNDVIKFIEEKLKLVNPIVKNTILQFAQDAYADVTNPANYHSINDLQSITSIRLQSISSMLNYLDKLCNGMSASATDTLPAANVANTVDKLNVANAIDTLPAANCISAITYILSKMTDLLVNTEITRRWAIKLKLIFHHCIKVMEMHQLIFIYNRVFNDKIYNEPFNVVSQDKLNEMLLAYNAEMAEKDRKKEFTRPMPIFDEGEIVGVRDKDYKWWMSRIIKIFHHLDQNFYFVEYMGWGPEFNEVISNVNRIRRYNPKAHRLYRPAWKVKQIINEFELRQYNKRNRYLAYKAAKAAAAQPTADVVETVETAGDSDAELEDLLSGITTEQ